MTFFLHLKLYQFQQPHLWNVGIPTLTVLFQEKPSIQQQNNDFCSTNLWYLHFPAIKTCVQVISSNDGWNIWKNHLKPSQTEVFQSKNFFFSGSRSDLCHLPPRLSPAKAVNFGRQVADPSRHTHADELQCWRKLLSDGRIDDDGYCIYIPPSGCPFHPMLETSTLGTSATLHYIPWIITITDNHHIYHEWPSL